MRTSELLLTSLFVLSIATLLYSRSRHAARSRRRLRAYYRLTRITILRALAGVVRREVTATTAPMSSEQSHLKMQLTHIGERLTSLEEHQKLDYRPWAASPFHFFTSESLDRLLRNPQGNVALTVGVGDRQYRLRSPHLDSAEMFECVTDVIERGNKVLQDECTLRIDLQYLKIEVVSRHGRGAGSHLAHLLQHFLARSPELLMGVLVPLAHLISGSAHSRKLANIDESVRQLLALRRCEQRATLDRIWLSATVLITGTPSAIARNQLATFCGELLQLRFELLREMEHAFGPKLGDMSAWRDAHKAKLLVQHLLPYLDRLWELQLAVAAEYFIRLATESTDRFAAIILPGEISRVDALVTTFEEHQDAVAAYRDLTALLHQGGAALGAYREFLTNLIQRLRKPSAMPPQLTSPTHA